MQGKQIRQLTVSAVLCAIGILIPMYSPVKILLEPASFTLASHVVIFIAMFISPVTAISVTLGTTIGFFLGSFPIVVVLRAASHVIFASCGAAVLRKMPAIINSNIQARVFSFFIALIHATAEVIVASLFYFGNSMPQGYYAKGFVYSVILLVGVGTVVHSMLDFEISLLIWQPLRKNFFKSIPQTV